MLEDIEASADKGRKGQDQPRHTELRVPVEGTEGLAQNRAEGRHARDLPAREVGAYHQHREQIQEAERDVDVKAPIDQRNDRDSHGGPSQRRGAAAVQEARKRWLRHGWIRAPLLPPFYRSNPANKSLSCDPKDLAERCMVITEGTRTGGVQDS